MKKPLVAISMGPLLLSGCASMQDSWDSVSEYAGRATGATLGAGLGYLACQHKSDLEKAACMTVGASAGWAIGSWVDDRRQAVEDAARRNNMTVVYQEVNASPASGDEKGLSATINDNQMFPSGSSRLTPRARQAMLDIARAYKDTPQKILIIGHTDSSGSGALNQRLSEARARTVAALFSTAGIGKSQLYYQGAGLSQPIANNDTDAGRAKNRRVEIVEITSEQSLTQYSEHRQRQLSNLSYSTLHNSEAETRARKASTVASIPSSTPDKPRTTEDTAHSRPSSTAPESTVTARPASSRETSSSLLALGGQPVGTADLSLYDNFRLAGASSLLKRLSPIGSANADTLSRLQHACYMDNYRPSGEIRALSSGKSIKHAATDYLRGLNQSVFVAQLENSMVGVGPVAILRDYTPASTPSVYIYKKAGARKADFKLATHVNVYEGDNRILYRAFVDQADAPVQCLDLVFDREGGNRARDGQLFYQGSQGLMTTRYQPARPKRH
ncbi:OmpA family protein [Larsenimonas rhizosphaerae]|uniref:OmpA family protein n=1 Tax=Larsenimonas rhizosphaerae TaxID=2944682 RepID=UPI00203371EC|nr:OmpA family protein [Larsenimonas rhizosphaerae]MCM2129794.1 OmpA family protein [Larsenimonas rhizosphaerae]